MRIIKLKLFALGAAVLMAGCTTTRLYEGKPLSKEASAIFHTNGSSSGPFLRWKVDGKKTLGHSLFSPKAVFLSPGEHAIEFSVFTSTGMIPVGTVLSNGKRPPQNFVFFRAYRFKASLAPGHSYQIEHPGWSLAGQKFEVCLYGEPHDAPGSKVSWGHETRQMSANAVKVQCLPPERVMTHDTAAMNPQVFPDYLVFRSP